MLFSRLPESVFVLQLTVSDSVCCESGAKSPLRFLSLKQMKDSRPRLRVDFTGDFGHEIGSLELALGIDGLTRHIDAELE